MSLRSIGKQLLQTTPSSLLGGASIISASFWIRANPANNVVAAGGVEVFGDSGGRFSATLSGTGGFRLQWSSNDGHFNATSACSLALIPGTAYHVASTWQAGSQKYYLNGVEVQIDNQVGSLGAVGDASSYPFRLGSDQAGTDVTLDQPTLWVGYTLTAQDVANLCNRSVQPGGIAPSSIALEWSLAGPDGVAANLGDAGLSDASPNRLALSSIVGTSPTYQAADLAYVATPTIGKLAASPSGKSILLIAEDGTGVDANISNIASSSEVQAIALTGTPAGDGFTLSFSGQSTATIPVTLSPPVDYALWTFPVVSGHSYNIAADASPFFTSAYILFETIQGGSVVASHTRYYGVSESNPISDPGALTGSGYEAVWYATTDGITASGSTMQVRITGAPDYGTIYAFSIRVQDVTAGTITYYSLGTTPSDLLIVGNFGSSQSNSQVYGGLAQYGLGTGDQIVTVTGGAPALQSALQALSLIGPGGVVVSDHSGSGSGNYQIQFAGLHAFSQQPLITCPDPAVSMTEVTRGGNFPSISINGGAPTLLINWLWTTAGDCPVALGILPQSAPAIQTFQVGQLPCSVSPVDTWGGGIEIPGSLSPTPYHGSIAGGTISFPFQLLPPGTYQIAITWQPTDYSYSGVNYTPATNTPVLVKDGSGNTLGSYTIDQTAAPASYEDANGRSWHTCGSFTTTAVQNALTLSITSSAPSSGNPIPVPVLDAVQLIRTSADASVVIGPTDSATVSIPANWLTTSAGVFPATANIPVAPPTKYAILPPFVAGPKTMKAGYNVDPAIYYQNFLAFSNLATLLELSAGALVVDANGYPTKIPKQSGGSRGQCGSPIIVSTQNLTWNDPQTGTFVLPNGKYIVRWDGSTTDLTFNGWPGVTVTTVPGMTILTGTTGNQLVFDLQADPLIAAGVSVGFNIYSDVVDPTDPTGNTFLCDLSNLQIYPPDPSDPTGNTIWGLDLATGAFTPPPKFHPWFLSMLRGMQCLRFLDLLSINYNPYASFDQIKPATHINRSGSQTGAVLPIASISAPAPGVVSPNYSAYALAIQVTTTVPHGLFDGAWCVHTFNVGSIVTQDGRSINIDQNIDPTYQQAVCQVVDATNLIIYLNYTGPAVMGATVTPTGATLQVNYGTPWPLEDICDLVTTVGCTDIHFNIAINADTSVGGCVDQIARFLATNLSLGVKVHVEYGNECWNYGTPTGLYGPIREGFITGNYAYNSYYNFYAQQTKAVHERFQAIFSSAGRPNDVVYLWGGWQGRGDVAANLLQHAQAIGARVDEMCVALYYSNQNMKHGLEPTQQPIYQSLDVDQVMDFFEFNSVYGEQDHGQLQVSAVFPASGYSGTRLIAYEGSVDSSIPDINGPNGLNYAVRRNAARRHPRMYGVMLNQAQVYQNAGMTLWNYFMLASQTQQAEWDAYEYANQQAGTGDPTLDAMNMANPQAKNLVKSETGGAWSYWGSLFRPAPSVKKNPYVLGRNGRGKAIGNSRGLFRSAR